MLAEHLDYFCTGLYHVLGNFLKCLGDRVVADRAVSIDDADAGLGQTQAKLFGLGAVTGKQIGVVLIDLVKQFLRQRGIAVDRRQDIRVVAHLAVAVVVAGVFEIVHKTTLRHLIGESDLTDDSDPFFRFGMYLEVLFQCVERRDNVIVEE